jgi:hypothetical protein
MTVVSFPPDIPALLSMAAMRHFPNGVVVESSVTLR